MNRMLIKLYKKLQHDLKHIKEVLFFYGLTPLSIMEILFTGKKFGTLPWIDALVAVMF